MKPTIGTLGIILAVALSLFAVVPGLVAAQPTATQTTTQTTTPGASPAGANGTTTPKKDPPPSSVKEPAATSTPAVTPGVSGPTFPTIPFDYFGGTVKDNATATPAITPDTFASCVEKQFGLRFQLLPAAVQTQVLKEYSRYAVSEVNCLTNAQAPNPVEPFMYFLVLVLGSAVLVGVFSFLPREWGFLNELIILPTPQHPVPSLDPAIANTMINAVVTHAQNANYTNQEFDAALDNALTKIMPPLPNTVPPTYLYKFSVSRLIALLGTYVIIVTFGFAARYGFWALSFGDNTVFEKITTTILIGGAAAFAPYVVNKISDAVKPAGK